MNEKSFSKQLFEQIYSVFKRELNGYGFSGAWIFQYIEGSGSLKTSFFRSEFDIDFKI